MISPSEAAELLREYNSWRRGDVPYPSTAKKVGEAIDLAISFLQAAEPSKVRRFRFGSVRYEVFPYNNGYKVVKNGWQSAVVEDSFIYDYCDTELARFSKNEQHKQNYFKAKHMAVALFKKQKKQ